MTLTLSVCHAWGIPRWRCPQRGWMFTLRVFQSCLSALAVSFLFREKLCILRPPVFSSSQGSVREKNYGQRIWAAGDKRAHVGSMPTCLAVTSEERAFCPSSSLNMISVPPLWATWSRSVRVTANRWQRFSGGFGRGGVIGLWDWPHPLTVVLFT